jgi:predicted aminopeptidase
VASSSGQEDIDNSPAAYNQSIYVMIGVPYACFAIFGCLIYRGYKKNEQYRQQMGYDDASDPVD